MEKSQKCLSQLMRAFDNRTYNKLTVSSTVLVLMKVIARGELGVLHQENGQYHVMWIWVYKLKTYSNSNAGNNIFQ